MVLVRLPCVPEIAGTSAVTGFHFGGRHDRKHEKEQEGETIQCPNCAKHSPSESARGGNNGKPGGPPLDGPATPLDRFFSHQKSVPE